MRTPATMFLAAGLCVGASLSLCYADAGWTTIDPLATVSSLSGAGIAGSAPGGGAHPRRVVVTRDPTGTPLTSYSDHLARQGPPAPFDAAILEEAGERAAGTVALVIETSLYASIATAIGTLSADLQAAGYSVVSTTVSGGTPAALRGYLQGISGLAGAILIGDLPVAWFEIDYEFDGDDPDTLDDEYTNFPCDLFYMDLDGAWQDLQTIAPFLTGVYDSHGAGSGDTGPEIWVSRLTTSTLTLGGATEAGLIDTYVAKDHAFRQGGLHPPQRMLLYVDDDWVDTAAYCDSSAALAYADRRLIQDKVVTCRDDYRDLRLTQGHEFMHVMLHATPSMHFFKVNDQWEMDGGSYAVVTSADIRARDPRAVFFSLYTCSACRFVETDYIGGWYIHAATAGLAAVGTTKVGGMWDYAAFYGALGAGRSAGGAFRDWLEAQAPYDEDDVRWFYGMTLLGDGSLALRPGLVAADPARHELGVPQNQRITLRFDRDLAAAPTPSTVRAYGLCSGRYGAQSSYDPVTRTFSLWGTSDLMDGETGLVVVTPGVRSADQIPAFPEVRPFTVAVGNPTTGSFAAGTAVPTTDTDALVVGDWNHDGWPDLAATAYTPNDRLYVVLNNGAGQFLTPVIHATGADPRSVTCGDYDGDGDLDLAVSNSGSQGNNTGVGVYFNQGNGSFAGPAYYYAGYNPGTILSVDVEADGDLDLVLTARPSWTQHYIVLLRNNGSGVFQYSHQYNVVPASTQVAQVAADLDGDGDIDLAGIRSTDYGQPGDSLVFYQNDGHGQFALSCVAALPDGPWGVAANDFDGDGDIDIAVGSVWTTTLRVLRNAGDGTMAQVQDLDQGGYSAHALVCGDWDGDGDLDLAHGRTSGTAAIRVWRNDGAGVFGSAADYAVWNAYRLAAADLDRDHDLDLVASAGAIHRFDNVATDVTPPARVRDLTGTAALRATGAIRWTAPGDDGETGRAALYDLRYAAVPVGSDSASWWNAARQATTEPLPSLAGVPDSCEIAGLSPDSTYYLVLRTRDDASNWSGYSNVGRMEAASAAVDGGGELAGSFRLEPVAPNPCRTSASIRFHLAEAVSGHGRLRLTLFDVQGRVVRRLIDRTDCPAGPHAIVWDLRNDAAVPVASGLYLCRLEAGGAKRTERILCVR